jgi:hypothetical protein
MREIAEVTFASVGYFLIVSFYVFCGSILGLTLAGGINWW